MQKHFPQLDNRHLYPHNNCLGVDQSLLRVYGARKRCDWQVRSRAHHCSGPSIQQRYLCVSRGGSAVNSATGTHAVDDINYNPSVTVGEFQGNISVTFYVNKCPEKVDVVVRFLVQRAQALPVREDGLPIRRIGLWTVV